MPEGSDGEQRAAPHPEVLPPEPPLEKFDLLQKVQWLAQENPRVLGGSLGASFFIDSIQRDRNQVAELRADLREARAQLAASAIEVRDTREKLIVTSSELRIEKGWRKVRNYLMTIGFGLIGFAIEKREILDTSSCWILGSLGIACVVIAWLPSPKGARQ